MGATGNNSYGWYAGGSGNATTVDRITYATDTATASARGPLLQGLPWPSAASGII